MAPKLNVRVTVARIRRAGLMEAAATLLCVRGYSVRRNEVWRCHYPRDLGTQVFLAFNCSVQFRKDLLRNNNEKVMSIADIGCLSDKVAFF